jgi:hypothetical protein
MHKNYAEQQETAPYVGAKRGNMTPFDSACSSQCQKLTARDDDAEETSNVVRNGDTYFSADVETDGPIPGPYSMLSFALVYAGQYDGQNFVKPSSYDQIFYREIKPISQNFEPEALRINQLDREKLQREGVAPSDAMNDASAWVMSVAGETKPVLAAYPVSFDWTWLYWYFLAFSDKGSPFGYSRCFDIKTAVAVKAGLPISKSGRSKLPDWLKAEREHTHHAVDDAIEQAEIFAKLIEWKW